MLDRRQALEQMISGLLWLPQVVQSRKGKTAAPANSLPRVDHPILFNTTEADRILESLQIFPPDNPWNLDVSRWPVHPNSKRIVAAVGEHKPLRYAPDMNFVIVPGNQKKVAVDVTDYAGESDPGPFPIPENMPIEGYPNFLKSDAQLIGLPLDDIQRDVKNVGGDRHAIIVDPANGRVHEFYQAKKLESGWTAKQASTFKLNSNALRPDGWTSSDAAGLPIFPSIVRYDQLKRGRIDHAMRVTVQKTRRAYVAPATHYASQSNDPNLPRMGERFRLKSRFKTDGFSPEVRVILEGLKRYGMLVADNGLDWMISVAPDQRIHELHEELRSVEGSDFEVVEAPRRVGG